MQHSPEFWDEPRFTTGVAAEMVALHPQTLRRYEDFGLVAPARSAGRRLYSPKDIEHLRQISRLSTELGLNLAGIDVLFHLQRRIDELQAEVARLHAIRASLEVQVATQQDQMRTSCM